MKIDYKETSSDLLKRIEIHKKFGTKDIDEWMLDLLKLKGSLRILDVGCGSGKQCFLFYDCLKGDCQIIGCDVSEELLDKARRENETRNSNIEFRNLDFNAKFPFPGNSFDLVTCCFAIYYAANASFTIDEMHRVLKPNGRLFVTGPLPDNKRAFYEIIRKATNREIPPMPGSSRFGSEILEAIKKKFGKTEVHRFENPLIFNEVEPFLEYTKASLSEDRKLWYKIFINESFDIIIDRIADVAKIIIEKDGRIVMTKVVGGFIAYKRGE